MSFVKSFEKTAAIKLPLTLHAATSSMSPKLPGYSKKSVTHMWKRRSVR